jgi:hypothetical protein
VVRPGDVLLAEDHVGKGHKWRLIDDQPWRRAYVVLKPGAKDSLIPRAKCESASEFDPSFLRQFNELPRRSAFGLHAE